MQASRTSGKLTTSQLVAILRKKEADIARLEQDLAEQCAIVAIDETTFRGIAKEYPDVARRFGLDSYDDVFYSED